MAFGADHQGWLSHHLWYRKKGEQGEVEIKKEVSQSGWQMYVSRCRIIRAADGEDTEVREGRCTNRMRLILALRQQRWLQYIVCGCYASLKRQSQALALPIIKINK